MDKRIEKFLGFLDASVSVYHSVEALRSMLEEQGYRQLREADTWTLQPGGKYYLIRGGTALMAFRVPEAEPQGFVMCASHSDRPTFKLKENGELTGRYTRLATEKYGGMIIAPWLDRPLSVAGRVMVKTPEGVASRLVNIHRDLLLIPNVAIHMNRSVNEGYAWNPAVDTLPLVGGPEAEGKLEKLLEEAAGGPILGRDLTLYLRQKATVWGVDEAYVSAAALDDLQCVWCCTQGFLKAGSSKAIPVLCVFDSEEVGSNSAQGAAADLLERVLQRICQVLGLDLEQELARSFMVSADNAHAVHPNHPEYADANNAPLPGGGVVIKFNAAQKYTTDGYSAAVFREICRQAEVPVQTFYNRADLPGGSTLGNISLAHVSVPTVDLGLAQLAMHSCYETASVQDTLWLEAAMTLYFSAAFLPEGDACRVTVNSGENS